MVSKGIKMYGIPSPKSLSFYLVGGKEPRQKITSSETDDLPGE